ncbi:MAG: MiaB/RimO family radical SAM methylthiotransferase [Candidatus Roizmanbacteria bacterium]
MKYFIKTFGCQQNEADSERISSACKARGMTEAKSYKTADYVVINTCMVKENAENRVYGLVNNLGIIKKSRPLKIIVTGCMVGAGFRDPSGKYLARLKKIMPEVDEFMPIEEVGFDHVPVRTHDTAAWVPITNGCNNFCTFCIVPFTRGRELSRKYEDVLAECKDLIDRGYTEVTLLGQNVNSYGADLLLGKENVHVMRDLPKSYFFGTPIVADSPSKDQTYRVNNKQVRPVYVKHLGRLRIPTLFPHLLEDVAKLGFKKVDFLSSNPWDFSDELIDVIARNKNITRIIHLPIQSGDDTMLKSMNRWYTSKEYMALVKKIKMAIPDIQFTTDIIVGFCGETESQFKKTVALCKKVGYLKAYISMYSPRPLTAATKIMSDDVPHTIKKARWEKLDAIINKPQLKEGKGIHTL